ncbi:DUF885 domain-containing protein [Pseudoduganella violaceinigra]|uniref:DUF885 domain-containing protein n=1 Tax=Pseudoduganella violaceinigra TaxID=246602 RepID=UPI0004243FFA|nr:DUF885 domain-containing protein [Pseudoduganella violaceinigra]
MQSSRLSAAVLIASLLASPLALDAALAAPAVKQEASQASRQLAQLANDFHIARASFDPLLFATANGDSRYNDQIGMAIAPDVRAKQFAAYRQMQARLATIPRTQLADQDKMTLDLLAYELDAALALAPFPEHLLPLNHFDNIPSTLANYASGTGSQPLGTVKQYQDYLSRVRQLAPWIDQAIANMREGIKKGVVHPKAITQAMLPQMAALRSKSAESSVYYSPIARMPASFSAADKARLARDYRTAVEQLDPALERLVRFLESEYLPASRKSTGWNSLPNGGAWYQARIHDSTNLPLGPQEIHDLGLKEVARISATMLSLRLKLDFAGSTQSFTQWMRGQKRFTPFATEAEVLDEYREIYDLVQARLPAYFSLVPKSKLVVDLEPALTRATASDHYTPPAADGSHPGVFWAVVNDPKDYNRTGMASLLLHEGVPGHHFHAALLKEMPLPDFRKFSTENQNNAAYTEGWALYAETLGKNFGLYEDPVWHYGHLNAELLRAVRLVVDTGMHSMGWPREKAIAYMVETLGVPEERAKNQVERYMVWPAQALSYKIGAMKILELRDRAQRELGAKFSYPAFHAVVLGDGTLPLPILETRVNEWIAKAKK